jgi:anti-sigma-K factor RskA
MTITERLRALDRKAGIYKQQTPDQWRRMAGTWRVLLANACFVAALVVAVALFVPKAMGGVSFLAFIAVQCAFRAGQMKAEDDRLRGVVDHVAGHRRPEGL